MAEEKAPRWQTEGSQVADGGLTGELLDQRAEDIVGLLRDVEALLVEAAGQAAGPADGAARDAPQPAEAAEDRRPVTCNPVGVTHS